MINSITYYTILGLPLIVYLGIMTLILFGVTAYTGFKHKPLEVHTTLAKISLAVALLHGILGVLAYL